MKLCPYKVFHNGILHAEHMRLRDAEKAAGRLLAVAKRRLTAVDVEVVDLRVSAALAARKRKRPGEQLQLI